MLPTENRLIGKMNYGIDRIYPKLEDLEVTPTGQDQHFKSEEYGYDNVTVKAVESEELSIMPNTEEQEYVGMFKKVTVPGDSDLAPENIVQDKEIFGVEGTAKVADFVITDAYHLCYSGHRQVIAQQLINMCGAITNAYGMLYGCSNLTEIDISKIDTSQCSTMYQMFYSCSNLTEIDVSNFVTNQCTDMAYMFGMCSKITQLDLSNFDMSKIIDVQYMLYCANLISIKSFKNLGKGYTKKTNNNNTYKFALDLCPNISYESILDIITNGLYDLNLTYNVANGGTLYTQSLSMGTKHLAKLEATEEGQQALALAAAKRLDCFVERRNYHGIKRTSCNFKKINSFSRESDY